MNQVNQHDLGEAIRVSREERGVDTTIFSRKSGDFEIVIIESRKRNETIK